MKFQKLHHVSIRAMFLLLLTSCNGFVSFRPPKQTTVKPLIRPERIICIGQLSRKNTSNQWEGDDIRWSSKLRRRIGSSSSLHKGSSNRWGRNSLVLMSLTTFLAQTVSKTAAMRRLHPAHWPQEGWIMILDAVWGSTVVQGRVTRAGWYAAALLPKQPYRALTAGFLHGGFLHLVANMDALRRLPAWLETGLGTPLYLTTFLVAIVTGSLCHGFVNGATTPVIGASAGITGLYALLYVCLVRMGNGRAAGRTLKGLVLLFVYGCVLNNVSNASHVGGFLGGLAVGVLCGPSYSSSYAMKRKGSLEFDNYPADYRMAMGFGNKPTPSGWIPLAVLWSLLITGLAAQDNVRNAVRLLILPLARTSV